MFIQVAEINFTEKIFGIEMYNILNALQELGYEVTLNGNYGDESTYYLIKKLDSDNQGV